MREVIARLLTDPTPQAARIIEDARGEAYPNQVLPQVYPDIGSERLTGLTDAFSESLRAVATEAGIAADELDAAVQTRRAAVQAEADIAAGEVQAASDAETDALQEESGAEVGEVEAAAEAESAHTAAVMAAAAGEGSPEVINARADQQMRKINRRVGILRFDYDRARDRRQQALDRALALQNQAYDRTATEDQAAITAEAGAEPTLTQRLEAAGIRNWADGRKRTVATRVRELKGEATTAADGFKGNVSDAGDSAVQQVRDWATARTGETRSWWQDLWASFFDWSQRAEVEAENWAVVRAGEARDATIQNMGVLQSFVDSQGEAVDLEANEAFQSLSAEQQAVIRAYYASPAGNRDALGAVAAGLAFRLAAEHKASLIETMRSQVLAKPDSEARNLEQIGMAETSTFSAEKISSELYEAMFGGLTGVGTDEDQIYRNISGLTPLQGRAVRAMYWIDHDRNLDSDLASELDEDNALIRARAALSGDPVMEAVGALNEAISRAGTDEDTVMRMLRGKTAEQRARIEEEYYRRYGERLSDELNSEMDDHDQERAEALLAGDTSRADAIALDQAMHGGLLGWGTDEAQIESVYGDIRNDVAGEQVPDGKGGMRPLTQEEMEAEVARRNLQVEATYDERYGGPADQESALRAAYRDELSGPQLGLANALADNDLVGADAARLEIERRGFYTDDDVVNGVLENQYSRSLEGLSRDPYWRGRREAIQKEVREREARGHPMDPYEIAAAERALDRDMEDTARKGGAANMAALENRYDRSYSRWGSGGLQTMIAFNMSGTDREKARMLVEQGGYLTRAQRVDFATRGPGTDEAEFERALAGATANEIAEINRELGKMGRPTVQSLAHSELSGREEQDMGIRLRGVPETAQEELRQARMRVNWELRNSPVGGHERDVMTARLARMERQYALINDPEADPLERRRALAQFQARGTGVQAGVAAYRAQVDAVTDAVATAAALTAAIAVTVLTGGIAGAVLGALAAAAMTMTVKSALKGAAYGVEEMAVDAVVGVVDAAAAVATFGVGNALLRVATSQGGRLARISGTRLAGVLSRMATSGSRAQRMLALGVSEAVEGAAGALPSALAGNMLNDQNWEHGNPLLNIVGGTLTETGMGAAMGGVMGSLGGFRAPRVEPPTPRTGDILAHRGTPQDRLDVWRAHKTENPGADMGTFLRQYDEQMAARLAAESTDATVQRALRSELLSGIPPNQRGPFANVPIEVMSDADFKALTQSESGNAVTLIEGGKPRIVLRDGAPPSALREEGIHLQQLADPELGPLVRRLDEGRVGRWDDLPLAEKLELYALKVELEIDAQRRLIAGLDLDIRRAGPDADVSPLRRQREIAADSLGNLRRRADEVADLGPLDRIAMAQGLRDPPAYLDQPARLFNKAAPPKVGAVTDSPLNKKLPATDEVRIAVETATVSREIDLDPNAKITALQDVGGVPTPVQLEVYRGQLFFSGPPRTPVPPRRRFQAGGGTPAFEYRSGRKVVVKRRVRAVEVVRTENGTTRRVAFQEETRAVSSRSLKEMGWRERGGATAGKGSAGELASRRLSERLLEQGDVVAIFDLQRPGGTGFDLVELRVGADGKPVLTLVEVKNYSENYVRFESFTAILFGTRQTEGNLLANLMDLELKLKPDLDAVTAAQAKVGAEFPDLTPDEIARLGPDGLEQRARDIEDRLVSAVDEEMARRLHLTVKTYRLALEAIQDVRLEALVRLGPNTLLGRSGAKNAWSRLRAHWSRMKALLGSFVPGTPPDIRGIREEELDPADFTAAEAAVAGQARFGRETATLTPTRVARAQFVDDEGNFLDVIRADAGTSPADVSALALRLQDRLTHPLSNGADVHLVVDLSDMTIDKASFETALKAELAAALGVTEDVLMTRLAILQTRN